MRLALAVVAAMAVSALATSMGAAAPAGSSAGAISAHPAEALVLAHGSKRYRGYRRDCGRTTGRGDTMAIRGARAASNGPKIRWGAASSGIGAITRRAVMGSDGGRTPLTIKLPPEVFDPSGGCGSGGADQCAQGLASASHSVALPNLVWQRIFLSFAFDQRA